MRRTAPTRYKREEKTLFADLRAFASSILTYFACQSGSIFQLFDRSGVMCNTLADLNAFALSVASA